MPRLTPTTTLLLVVFSIALMLDCGGNAASPTPSSIPTPPSANTPTTPPPPPSGGSGTGGSSGTGGGSAAAYSVQELANFPGGGVSMNINAQITGTGGMHAWIWSNGQVTDLGTLGGPGSYGQAINDSGQVAGVSGISTTNSYLHAFLYSGGKMTDLGTLGGNTSIASGMNNSGQVVGYSETGSNPPASHGFVYSNGNMQDLTPNVPVPSAGRAINDSGVIVGYISPTGGNAQATMWVNGVAQPLINDTAHQSMAFAISNTQYVAGIYGTSNFTQHAFRWFSGTLTDLGTLPNRDASQGNAVNDAGIVVGSSYIYGKPPQNEAAFIYQNGQMQDLNSLIPPDSGWVLTSAAAINNKGQILAAGSHNGQGAYCILNPTK